MHWLVNGGSDVKDKTNEVSKNIALVLSVLSDIIVLYSIKVIGGTGTSEALMRLTGVRVGLRREKKNRSSSYRPAIHLYFLGYLFLNRYLY